MDEDAGTEIVVAAPPPADPIPAFTGQVPGDLRQAIGRAVDAWLLRTPSPHTRKAYAHRPRPVPGRQRHRSPTPASTSPPSGPSTSASGVTGWPPAGRPTAPSAAS